MKRIVALVALFIGAVAVGGLLLKDTFNFGTVSYQRETVEVEKIKEVDALEKRIKDAQDAQADLIETASEQAKQAKRQSMLEVIELKVREDYGKELDAKELELKKKQASY